MARSRGYNSYRGRRSKGKTALAALLILVILAAVVVILLQKHIVYDEIGTPRLDVPWQEDSSQAEETPTDLDLVIQVPEKTVKELHAFSFPVGKLTKAVSDSAVAAADPSWDAVAVSLKDPAGMIYFDATVAVSASVNVTEETATVLADLTSGERFHTIARISCFHDPKAANADVDGMGLKNTGGFIFYDGSNSQWLDPAKPAARQYLCDLAVEAARLGFDEILLTDFGYPTNGKLEKIAYGETAKNANLLAFLQELKAALQPYDTVISVELPAAVMTEGQEENAGLILAEIVPEVDRVYASALPEETEALSATVTALNEGAMFVPILPQQDPAVTGSYLLS